MLNNGPGRTRKGLQNRARLQRTDISIERLCGPEQVTVTLDASKSDYRAVDAAL
jgi:hypothetical protein